ncbi:helix-turn-helix transcriptional regulator [Pseudomonas aeruginosa]|uniref:helix-turn-helix transcriptional regulator n=1 Tax=Pseudomonadaceae TaxID=135621 RepID=UPI001FFCB2E5|nr:MULTISPECIES: helix-turn-helix transcriptional regulator [Pseudomonas]MCK2119940.1 helix-turn-helix transcriptional regulator [Pseudomonas sp. PNPG3]WAG81576.1 helix-turn-helix transcriptional regulator [Pseudomonas furukawaii]HEP8861218.1 helix-turn-helix transcriptional regulator [Pseudomonas aeruginosa]
MLDALSIHPAKQHVPISGLGLLVGAIGDAAFWPRLIDYLNSEVGGEHCAAWQLTNERMHCVGAASWNGSNQAQRRLALYAEPAFWRRDPGVALARRCGADGESIIIRMTPRLVSDTLIRETLYGKDHIVERIMACRLQPGSIFGLNVLRSEEHGPFSGTQMETFSATAGTLLSILQKHEQLVKGRPNDNPVSEARLPEVEQALQVGPPPLSRREAQVCARMICGFSLQAIANELGVSHETIETYRKRAYLRLEISSKQELLLRYLGYG